MRTLFLTLALSSVCATPALAGAGPQRNFLNNCAGCHQMDGSGAPRSGIPDMRGAVGHFLRLAEGREFLVKVPGTANSPLGHAETAEMLNWMVYAYSREQVPADFKPYTGAEVERLRKQVFHDVPGTRAALVQRLQGMGYRVE
jgi:mono/diheme cytochrome c family protein